MESQTPQTEVRRQQRRVFSAETACTQVSLLRRVEEQTQKAFSDDPDFKKRSLTSLNNVRRTRKPATSHR